MLRTSPLQRPDGHAVLRRGTSLLVAGALAATLAGCGQQREPERTPAAASESVGTSPTPTPSPSPAVTASLSPSPAARPLAARLLSVDDLATGGPTRSQGATGPAGPEPLGVCHQFDLATIGATRTLQRAFTAEDGTTATQQLATFPDEMSVARAGKVVQAWRDDCQRRMRGKLAKLQVGRWHPVSVPDGSAGWYLTSWMPEDDAVDGHFQSLGIAVRASRLALVALDHDGPAHPSPPPSAPLVTVLRAAAAKLG